MYKFATRTARALRRDGPIDFARRAARFVERRSRRYYLESVAPNEGVLVENNIHDDIERIAPVDASVIVDAGAYQGDVTATFLNRYPRATVHAFEPQPDLADHLRERFASDNRVQVHECAVGPTEDTVTFNQLQGEASSSVLTPGPQKREYYGDHVDIADKYDVEQVRLDAVLDEAPDIVKLDLQGYELGALRGATSFINQVDVIFTEVEFKELYEGQALFADVQDFLSTHGFHLFNFYNLYTEETGQLTWGDAIFRRHQE